MKLPSVMQYSAETGSQGMGVEVGVCVGGRGVKVGKGVSDGKTMVASGVGVTGRTVAVDTADCAGRLQLARKIETRRRRFMG